MTAKIGDVGTEIIVKFKALDCNGLTVALDIADNTTLQIVLCPPSGVGKTKTAIFTVLPCSTAGDGTDGFASYFTVAGDFDETGEWTAEGYVVKPAGTWATDPITFEVEARVCP